MPENHSDNDRTVSFVALTKGVKVGHYKIIKKIGSGGMGDVYLAKDSKLNRQVALKFLPPQFAFDRQHKARFRREGQAVAKLNHPNVVTIHEVSEFGSRPYLVMEYVGDQILGDFFKKKDCSLDKIVKLAIQICYGLKEAHNAGIVHRDIKPSNILIDKSGCLKLVDFGLATIAGSDKLTKTGSTLGTIGYMSPEQVEGHETDNRSDIFSFGVILYEMLTCQRPFKKEGEAATLKAILDDTPEPLARFKSDLPNDTQRIISKTLEKNAENRYQHVEDIIVDLQKLIDDSKPGIVPFNRSKAPLIVAFGLIFAVIMVGGYFIYDLSQETTSAQTELAFKNQWQNSIAVLPFRDFSQQKDQEYFCDGMTDVIIGKLSQLKDLKIISMSSVMRYKNPERNLKEIGQELNVATILEGSIQREGGRVRITTQLINVADDAHLWAQTFDKELESIFAIQDEISREIVKAMEITLLTDDQSTLVKHHTDNLEAYDFYLRGRHFWNRRTEADLLKAIDYFEKAINLDSNFALAFTGLADAYAVLPGYSNFTDTECLPIAKEAAQMALSLDGNLAEAYVSYAFILADENKHEQAEKGFLKAIKLNPGYATAHQWYALTLDKMFRPEDALKELELAFELDPLSLITLINLANKKAEFYEWNIAEELIKKAIEIDPTRSNTLGWYSFLLLRQGRFDESLQMIEKAMELSPEYINNIFTYGINYFYRGQYDNALEQLHKAKKIDSSDILTRMHLGLTYFKKGMFAEARKEFSSDALQSSMWGNYFNIWMDARLNQTDNVTQYLIKIEKNPNDITFPLAAVAMLYAIIDDDEKVFEWLNRAYEAHDFYLTLIMLIEDFDKYKNNPRYLALLDKMGLPR
ncbi:MAG: protein kinase [candidate division Zixibacteria bacterium]|nr:protein kinase [candidate division Zixibacteria bacterium]